MLGMSLDDAPYKASHEMYVPFCKYRDDDIIQDTTCLL